MMGLFLRQHAAQVALGPRTLAEKVKRFDFKIALALARRWLILFSLGLMWIPNASITEGEDR